MNVIVAGAGLAGLSAAFRLARAGVALTIVDAREYAGGRVRTARAFDDGQHAELGGEFIESEHKALRSLCADFDLTLMPVLRAGFTHRFRDGDGFRLSRSESWDALGKSLAPLVRRYRMAAHDASADDVREFATMSLREWLRSTNASVEQHAMADALRGFFLADPDDLSVLPVVEQFVKGGSPAQGHFCRVEGGASRLVDALVQATPARLLLRHQIRRIVQAAERVVVTVTDASGMTQTIEADAVVVALPASTLREVEIKPALPDDQARAIRRLAYGPATKVLIQSTRSLFARRRARAFATDTRCGAFWDANEEQDGAGSIVTFLGGGSASGWLREAAEHGPEAVLADLCWLGMADAPVATMHVADWESDPWARGGYAYLDPAFDPAWRPLLGRRAGRIVFAGEHTSQQWQGYMNGAVESGQRAARELIEDS